MTKREKFNLVDFIIDYEAGLLSSEEIVKGFQHMIDTGIVWHLQGSYGRTAAYLIDAGLCHSVEFIEEGSK